MDVATGAISTLLPKLGDLLKEEYKLQKGVRGEIMFLKAELDSMQTALRKVSEAPIDQPPDIQVKLWARDVKELSYDIEDTIDAFMVRVGTRAPKKLHGLRGFINRSLDLLTKAKVRHKIGTDIEDIKSRITKVRERRDNYKVDIVVANPAGQTIDSLRLSALYKKATELVGTGEKSDDLIKWLMEGDEPSKQQLKIVSIVGFGGLGKTTLANVVYQKLKVQFDCGAFISVSLNPNMDKIFKNMLHQLGKHSNIDDEAQLINELREFLRNRRYFVVIDDIWNNSVWERIKCALIENECGSRIITTTRILDVAKHVGGVYQLKPLSPVDSRKLFYQRIFGVEDECPHNQLAEVSERILKKCGGVPLAIITIASLLASRKEKENTQKYWSKVCQSIGSGLEGSLDVDNMRRILSLSYYDLPPHLKTCLLYLSLYPEDYVVPAVTLIWKWIGEGFVQNEQGKRLHEVGEDYLDELINKSLIQPVNITTDNKYYHTRFCRVHDMVLDLITSLSNEEHFLTTLGGQQPMTVPTKIRRLSLQTSNEDDVKQLSTMSLSHVRSLTMFEEEVFSLLPALSSFPVLRALDLHGCDLVENRHCKDICNLFHLMYLNLSGTSISEIPKEIGNLQSLQVLDISYTGIEELPSTFVQLGQLVYLKLDWSTRLPDGFGNLKCLQELQGISISSPTMLHDLGGLTKLRHLDINFGEWDERYEEHFLQCLSNLVSLEILETGECKSLGSLCENLSPGPQLLRSIEIWIIPQVPMWMSSLSSLSYLHIRLETLGVEDLQVLGGIPSLGDLVLHVQQPTEGRDERLIIGSGYPFRCLRKLQFSCDTMEVVFAQGAMQKLQTLELKFWSGTMDQFCDFDFGLENLSSLKHTSVEMRCDGAEPWEVEAAEAAIRRALDMNPNIPTLEFKMIMAPTAVPTSSFALRSVLDKEKLNGTNFADWSRNLRIVLRQDKKEHVLEEPIPDVPAENAAATLKSAYKKACDESLDVSCLMLAAMNSDLQKQFENIEAYDMIVALKGMFETQARTERYEIPKNLFGCKLAEGSPVSPHVIKMVGYSQSLEKLGFPLSQELATDLILASLPASYGQFIMNFHMNGLDKNLTELHMMLKTAEDSIKKSNSHVMMVQKSTSFKKKAKTWFKGKGKAKVSDMIKTNKPKPKTKSGPTQENECFYCKEPGHWKRNCKKYLADLKKNGGTKPSTSESNKD